MTSLCSFYFTQSFFICTIMGNLNSSMSIEKQMIVPKEHEIAEMEDVDPYVNITYFEALANMGFSKSRN